MQTRSDIVSHIYTLVLTVNGRANNNEFLYCFLGKIFVSLTLTKYIVLFLENSVFHTKKNYIL